jgi:hypothetical protein
MAADLMETFRIAPMSGGIAVLTATLLAIPAGMFVGVFAGVKVLAGPSVLIGLIYGCVWLLFRPTKFVIHKDALEIIWPLKRRRIERASINGVSKIDAKELKREIGWGARIGAGGLWGGFGWLWTRHRGVVEMYISRTDSFVWIECGMNRPLLITPEWPNEFVRALLPK